MHTDPYDAYTIQMPTMSVVQMVHGSLSSAHQIANELRNVGEEREKKKHVRNSFDVRFARSTWIVQK